MRYTPKEYAETLYGLTDRISERAAKNVIRRFVKALSDNNDLSKTGLIVEEFEKIWREAQGRKKVEVTVAPKENTAHLKEKLKGDVIFEEDPNILGGIKIRIGDKLIDNTIRARINRLKESLGV